jgi:hypothetical protein
MKNVEKFLIKLLGRAALDENFIGLFLDLSSLFIIPFCILILLLFANLVSGKNPVKNTSFFCFILSIIYSCWCHLDTSYCSGSDEEGDELHKAVSPFLKASSSSRQAPPPAGSSAAEGDLFSAVAPFLGGPSDLPNPAPAVPEPSIESLRASLSSYFRAIYMGTEKEQDDYTELANKVLSLQHEVLDKMFDLTQDYYWVDQRTQLLLYFQNRPRGGLTPLTLQGWLNQLNQGNFEQLSTAKGSFLRDLLEHRRAFQAEQNMRFISHFLASSRK